LKASGISRPASVDNPLRARRDNGFLHLTGLTAGKTMSIHNTIGALVYHKMVESNEADIPLRVQGMYIVRSGNNSVKVVF
jgi:hypothetical protein